MTAPNGKPEVNLLLPAGMAQGQALAAVTLDPALRHASLALSLGKATVGSATEGATIEDAFGVLNDAAVKARGGDMAYASDTLVSQAHTLDSTVTELMRRAWSNAGEYPHAFDRYMSLALKAQAQCRATLEALAKLHQPREQVVRHVHVHEGGQAVVAEQFHHHPGGTGNAGIANQAHAAGSAPVGGAALSSPDPLGHGVPVPGGQGQAALPHARRGQGKRGASGKSKRAEARPRHG